MNRLKYTFSVGKTDEANSSRESSQQSSRRSSLERMDAAKLSVEFQRRSMELEERMRRTSKEGLPDDKVNFHIVSRESLLERLKTSENGLTAQDAARFRFLF